LSSFTAQMRLKGGSYALEEAGVTIDEAQLVLAALAGIRQADRRLPRLR
jgi:hypothetical protein